VAWYASPLLRGQPVLTERLPRTDVLEYDWSEDPPPAGIPLRSLGVRLATARTVEEGEYLFTVQGAGRLTLTIDGRIVIDRWRAGRWDEIALVPLFEGTHRIVLNFGASPSLAPWLAYEMTPVEEAGTPEPLLRGSPPTPATRLPLPAPTAVPWWRRW